MRKIIGHIKNSFDISSNKEGVMSKKTCLILAMVISFLMVMSQSSPGTAMTWQDEDRKKAIMEKTLKMQMPFIANSGKTGQQYQVLCKYF